MNLNRVIIVIAFVTSILIISSSHISFSKKNDKEEENDGEDLKKDIPVSSIDKTKKINRDSKEKTEVQNDILNGGHYPNQYYVCGYPQQLITDYNFFEKFNCN
jgi:hypothetical protein